MKDLNRSTPWQVFSFNFENISEQLLYRTLINDWFSTTSGVTNRNTFPRRVNPNHHLRHFNSIFIVLKKKRPQKNQVVF